MIKFLEKQLKQFLLFIIRIFLPPVPKKDTGYGWQDFRNILVFRLDNRLGNSILILSLVQSIKRSLPGANVDLMMTVNYIALYDNHPDISSIIAYDQKYLFRNPMRYIILIRKLKKNNYDVVFSSSNPDTLSVSQAIFSRLVSNGRSVGFDWKESTRIYSDVIKGNTAINYARSQVDLWRYFDQQAEDDPPRLYFLKNETITPEKDMLIWLGATGNKILSQDIVTRLVAIAEDLNLISELAAGPHDDPLIQRYSDDLRRRIQSQRLDLLGISKYYKSFKIIMMPDTGPMHLVAALGIPLVQVFIGSNPVQYGYQGADKFIINGDFDKQSLINFIKKFVI